MQRENAQSEEHKAKIPDALVCRDLSGTWTSLRTSALVKSFRLSLVEE